jgi:hypothetical protein
LLRAVAMDIEPVALGKRMRDTGFDLRRKRGQKR